MVLSAEKRCLGRALLYRQPDPKLRTMAGPKPTSCMLVEPFEQAIEVRRQKQETFYGLARRFRSATDPKSVERPGHELGRMAVGG